MSTLYNIISILIKLSVAEMLLLQAPALPGKNPVP